MTHDELMALVDSYKEGVCNCKSCNRANAPARTLHAVLNLHKPELHQNDNVMGCSQCSSFSFRYIEYPCPTIQAIEKEMG